MGINIAIDGPAGAGKSTIAKLVAKEKGFIYVDTGAMYRAIALYLIRNNVALDDSESMVKFASQAEVSIKYVDGQQQVILNGEIVNGLIRTEEVSKMASVSSAVPEIRTMLLELQRKLARENDVVMDGRDIGTNILPNAQYKIFLTASAEERANRRYKELVERGEECDYEKIKADIIERDERDSNRATAPLKQAEDAILVDSSNMTIDEVAKTIIDYCK
ncbi:MAG: (d)CMP kinase [Lachnospiraceae bacterium]|nr:(d)CMP kinase [Lachnospiraceae bacterium]